MIRQGDILLVPVDSLPRGATRVKTKPKEGIIVAAGEVTGHHHRIRTPKVRQFTHKGVMYIDVPKTAGNAELEHEEHATLTLAPGVHKVVRQREYEPPKETAVVAPRPRWVTD